VQQGTSEYTSTSQLTEACDTPYSAAMVGSAMFMPLFENDTNMLARLVTPKTQFFDRLSFIVVLFSTSVPPCETLNLSKSLIN
jgi:hypothetical protein